jgi:hypothetical protein
MIILQVTKINYKSKKERGAHYYERKCAYDTALAIQDGRQLNLQGISVYRVWSREDNARPKLDGGDM